MIILPSGNYELGAFSYNAHNGNVVQVARGTGHVTIIVKEGKLTGSPADQHSTELILKGIARQYFATDDWSILS